MADDGLPQTPLPVERAEAEQLYRDVEQEVALPQHLTGADSVAAVLCVLSQRLTAGEAEDLARALPAPVRPALQRCPRHAVEQGRMQRLEQRHQRPERFQLEGFLDRVSRHLQVSLTEAEAIARAVFAVVRRRLPEQESRHVASQLPADLRQLWAAPESTPPITAGARPPEDVPPPNRLTTEVLEDIRRSGVLPTGVHERQAVKAVLCTLSQRLTRGEARDLMLSLPPGLRPLIERCALHRAEPGDPFDRETFLRRVAEHLAIGPEQARALTVAVLAAVKRAIAPREVHDVASQLPADLRDLWTGPDSDAAAPPF